MPSIELFHKYKTLSSLSVFIGSISLFLFFHFVICGPFKAFDFQFSISTAIVFNFLLSAVFFIQHSLMIRKAVREKIDRYLPKESFYAFHSICSGILLGSTVLLWQETDLLLLSVSEPYNYLFRTITISSIVGLLWAIKSLTDFDPFGRKQISNFLKNRKIEDQVFILRGPYKITRHPFYFFILLMMWSYPVMTLDRLLFSLSWTIWVTLGSILEEKDLVKEIGNDYVKYQAEVPMLVPFKIIKWKG